MTGHTATRAARRAWLRLRDKPLECDAVGTARELFTVTYDWFLAGDHTDAELTEAAGLLRRLAIVADQRLSGVLPSPGGGEKGPNGAPKARASSHVHS